MPAQWKRPVTFASRREERVRDSRDDRDRADFARSAHSIGIAVDNVYLDRRRFIYPWNLEVVEVRLDCASVLERNVRLEGHTQSPYGSSLDRVFTDVRIECDAAIYHAGDAMNLHQTTVNR